MVQSCSVIIQRLYRAGSRRRAMARPHPEKIRMPFKSQMNLNGVRILSRQNDGRAVKVVIL